MPDVMEKTTDTTAESQPKVAQPKYARPHPTFTRMILLAMILSVVAIVISIGAVCLHWSGLQVELENQQAIADEEEELKTVEYITFGNYSLPINGSLAVNSYDQSAFVVGDNGLISYGDARWGIDVSQHQGEIDWQAVADYGISFAMIRLGYRGYGGDGIVLLDDNFHQNIQGAKEAGLDVGVYFFSQATSVWETQEEAYFVLEHLEGYELELPVVFNWEFIDNYAYARTNGVPGQSITLYNQVFNEMMQKAGYDTMVYFSQTFAYLYLELDQLSDNAFWLASYRNNPNFYYDFDIWQYTDTGTVDGIEGYVDLNLMLRDLTLE